MGGVREGFTEGTLPSGLYGYSVENRNTPYIIKIFNIANKNAHRTHL